MSGGQIFTGKNVITQMCLPTDTKVVCRKAQADKDLTEEQAVQYGDQDAEQLMGKQPRRKALLSKTIIMKKLPFPVTNGE